MDHRSDDEEELWSTPKSLTGAGDGLKTFKHPTVGNTPKKLNSHKVSDKDGKIRKKTPNTVMVKKTEQNRLRKACSIAEITPTKTRTLKKINVKSTTDANDKQTLHATPRPLLDAGESADRGAAATKNTKMLARPCGREWAVCAVYQRLLLRVWRRSKRDLQTLNESSRRHMDQLSQLQLQINCLKGLSAAESVKRREAVNENVQLTYDVSHLRAQLNEHTYELIATKNQLNSAKRELDDVQSRVDGKTEEISAASIKLSNYEVENTRLTKEKCDLEDKLLKVEAVCENLAFIQCENEILMENLRNDFLSKDKLIEELRGTQANLLVQLEQLNTQLAMPKKIWKTFQSVAFSCAYFLDRFANLILPLP